MLITAAYILTGLLVLYVGLSVIYNFALFLAYFLRKERVVRTPTKARKRFAIIVPSHNEELLISKFCESMGAIDYPASKKEVFIIADNCADRTAEIASGYDVKVMERRDLTQIGKGFALQWAVERIDLDAYDAVLVIDTDTNADPKILIELDRAINAGADAIQCYIEVPNRDESWFTQLIYVSRTINNLFYHFAKHKLGLSAYLMGSGMCFTTRLLKEMSWNAFSLSEDWEYFAKLVERGKRVHFASRAIVLQQESKSLNQATTQRLRWASGRFHVVKSLGIKLLAKGLLKRDVLMADASFALLFPNWSLQINLILLSLLASWMLPHGGLRNALMLFCLFMLGAQAIILAGGIARAGKAVQVMKAVMIAPVFLAWKLAIDILCMTGLYRGKKWIRTKRHVPG